MKFYVNGSMKCGPRLGELKEIKNHHHMVLETPMAMLYTRGGSIPHITNEVFKLLCKDSQIIQIPLVSTYNFEEPMSEFPGNIASFVGMKDCISCMTVQDPADYTQPGHHFQDCIPLWTRQGKALINAKLYMNAVEAFKPDMYYLLSDGDTNITSSSKRTSKAVNNTVTYFKQCMERHSKSEVLKNSFVMGAIAGGYCLKARKQCIDAVSLNNSIDGYLIDGLHNNGPEVELQEVAEVKPLVQFIIDKLPPEKLKAMHGCWNPVIVLQMVQLGVDMFDTSYCYIVTERSSALTFSLDLEQNEISQYEINLREPQFSDDFQPILPGCTCLACSKYSRGYIHHLVTVQELLGPLLVTIHNVHHYLKFFEKIRECIREGTLEKLEEKIRNQFLSHQDKTTKGQEVSRKIEELEEILLETSKSDQISEDESTEDSEINETIQSQNLIVGKIVETLS